MRKMPLALCWSITATCFSGFVGHRPPAYFRHTFFAPPLERFSNTEGLKKGMVVSKEPGDYKSDNFGICIKIFLISNMSSPGKEKKSSAQQKRNSSILKADKDPHQKEFDCFQVGWLDTYHEEVFTKVSPLP
jgi:hypothetical protein